MIGHNLMILILFWCILDNSVFGFAPPEHDYRYTVIQSNRDRISWFLCTQYIWSAAKFLILFTISLLSSNIELQHFRTTVSWCPEWDIQWSRFHFYITCFKIALRLIVPFFLIKDFTAKEMLTGDNRYYCQRCKVKRPACKQFTTFLLLFAVSPDFEINHYLCHDRVYSLPLAFQRVIFFCSFLAEFPKP